MRRWTFLLVLGIGSAAGSAVGAASPRSGLVQHSQMGAALDDIVGVWQSDTTNGTSARSTCTRSPTGSAVICEQAITTPTGNLTALSLYTFDGTSGHFIFYNLSHAGDVMSPLALTIKNHRFIYGGVARSGDGTFYRTVNDFSAHSSYTWRQESSADGVRWTPQGGGRSVRVR